MIYFPDRWDSILKISKAPKHTSAALRSLETDDDGSLRSQTTNSQPSSNKTGNRF
ncbi:hypothetical protein LEP1GSC120_3939 [Leptospira santarosai str. 200702252]|nr:hypothetical protein LEP1GSC120_3939 [Leptospira santarosai str. 200702252]